ncbi:ABC transporter ATP-binding protein/permease [Candidatus Pelagibacter sp.]|nr:ABC transporter ATP-binding protein/permease [Candidatus Pelagibacter sp.]
MFFSLLDTIKKISKVVNNDNKSRIFYLIIILIAVSVLELLSLGLLPTLIAKIFIISDVPPVIKIILDFFYLESITSLIIFISFIFLFKFIALFYANYFELITLRKLRVFVSKSLITRYSQKKYNFFVSNNLSLLSRNILVESENFVGLIQSLIIILREISLLLVIFALLIIYQPTISFFIFSTLILASLLFYKLTDKVLKKIAIARIESLGATYKLVNQFFNLIKEIKILKKENFFTNKFHLIKDKYESKLLISNLIQRLPKIFFELLTVIIFLFLMLYFALYNKENLFDSLPFLGLIVICMIKLLPSFNGISGALTHFQSYLNSFHLIYEQINELEKTKDTSKQNLKSYIKEDEELFLKIKDLDFKYDTSTLTSLFIKNLSIKKCEMIGIIGKSGSGKTTLINLILNLFDAQKGSILFYKNFEDIKIGHVPQDIEIFDDTLKNNIAFGVKEENIDNNKVYEIIQKAGLQKFLEKNNFNLDMMLGDKGLKISGGERQRIGIARSLYIDPDFLIFDEATSSLDIKTEKILLDEIEKLRGKITTIFISHRLSALEKCNMVYLIDSGKIIAKGTTKEILEKYPNLTIE